MVQEIQELKNSKADQAKKIVFLEEKLVRFFLFFFFFFLFISLLLVRAYASVAWLNSELYVFGGGYGSAWHNTGIDFCSYYRMSLFV